MPSLTYTPVANITLGASAASVTFSSISQTYRDLVLVAQVKDATTGTQYLRVNADSGTNYSFVKMQTSGSTGASSLSTTATGIDIVAPTNTNWADYIVQFMDYSATDKHKVVLARSGRTAIMNAAVSRWANTAAITSIVFGTSGTFAAGSTFALYGIAS